MVVLFKAPMRSCSASRLRAHVVHNKTGCSRSAPSSHVLATLRGVLTGALAQSRAVGPLLIASLIKCRTMDWNTAPINYLD